VRPARAERPRWVHALILAGVLLTFGVSFWLLSRVIGITSPWLVLLLMFYFLAIAKVAEPLFRLKVPGVLRPLRPWERRRDVYRRLGVLSFGRLLRLSPLSALNSAVYLDRGDKDPARVRLWIESSEASHFWAAVLFTPYVVFAALRGMWSVVAWFSLAQLLLNVYPILHLRYVRGRLDRAFRGSAAAHAS
jgi:hypothetical protein